MSAYVGEPDGVQQPCTASGRFPVLMYHDVRAPRTAWEQRYCVEPRRFEDHLHSLREAGYAPCTLRQFAAWLSGEAAAPDGAVLMTFDDGYQGVYDNAYPLLRKFQMPFVVFVVTSAMGRSDRWLHGAHHGDQPVPLMSRTMLEDLIKSGVDVGSHSRSHADLPATDSDTLRDEVRGSKLELEDMLGLEVTAFAYPYGRMNEKVRGSVADAGYLHAFSTRAGLNKPGDDPLTIRRLDVYGTDNGTSLLRKIGLGTNDGTLLNYGRYYARRMFQRLRLW